MIIEKLIDQDCLTETEKHIANYLLDKSNDIENLTSTELGKKSYTSQSAVMRLYKKIGVNTYREFISALILERNEYFKVGDVNAGHPSQYFSSYTDIQNTISRLYAETMIHTNLLLDKNIMIRACNRLLNAQSIDIYGIGISEVIAKQMSFKLQSIGFNCTCQNGLNYAYIKNMKECQKNVSVLISLTGVNDAIMNIAKILKEKKIYTVVILGKKENQIQELGYDILLFDTNEYEDIDIMCSAFAAEYIVNLIYSMLLSRLQIHQTSQTKKETI